MHVVQVTPQQLARLRKTHAPSLDRPGPHPSPEVPSLPGLPRWILFGNFGWKAATARSARCMPPCAAHPGSSSLACLASTRAPAGLLYISAFSTSTLKLISQKVFMHKSIPAQIHPLVLYYYQYKE